MRSFLSWTAAAAVILSQSCTKNEFAADSDRAPDQQQSAQAPETPVQPSTPQPPENISNSTGSTQPAVNANQATANNVLKTLADELLKLPGAGANNVVGDGGETPLVFDWNSDSSISMLGTDAAKRILFDIDGDGTLDFLEWISPNEAFLALDRNLNGSIDSGKELFGSATPGRKDDLRRHGNGFAALSEFDDNSDGVIDSADQVFAKLSVWRDVNSNGRTDAFELTSIATTQVRSISLQYANLTGPQRQIAGMRSTVGQIGSAQTINGAKMTLFDVHFAVMARSLFVSASSSQRGGK
jgi:hypothetical protein